MIVGVYPSFDGRLTAAVGIEGLFAEPINLHELNGQLVWWNDQSHELRPSDKWSEETEAFFEKTKKRADAWRHAKTCKDSSEILGTDPDRVLLWPERYPTLY